MVSQNESSSDFLFIQCINIHNYSEKLLFVLQTNLNDDIFTGHIQVEPISVVPDSELNPIYKEITIFIDSYHSQEKGECLCLMLSPFQNSNLFFNDKYQIPLCFEDNTEGWFKSLIRWMNIYAYLELVCSSLYGFPFF